MDGLYQKLKEKAIAFYKKSDSLSSQIFWMSFLCLIIIDCVENTSVIYSDAIWVKGMYLFRNLLYLILLAKAAFLSEYTQKEMMIVGSFFVIGFLSLLGSGDFGFLKFFIIAIASKGKISRKFVKVYFGIKTTAIFLTVLLWKIGIMPALYYQDDKVGYYNTFGFCHRNVLGANIVILCLAWFYIRYRKLKIQDVAVWSGIAVVTYMFALSRTSLIIQIVTIVGVFLFQQYEERILGIPKIQKIVLGGFLGIIVLCIFCTLFYSKDNFIWGIIDKIFTKRIRFSNLCFKEYGLSLFGQRIPFVSSIEAQSTKSVKLILDNAYMRVLLYNGLIPGAMFLGIYYRALKVSLQKRDCALLCGLIVFAIYGLSERYMLDVFYQFPLLIAFGECFFPKNRVRKNECKKPVYYLEDVIRVMKRNRR